MKKLYIQPASKSQEMHFTGNLCVGSVQSNVNLEFIGDTDGDPI